MKDSRSGKSEKIDRWLIGFSLLGMLIFFYLLSDQSLLTMGRDKSEQVKIGTVKNLKKDVRRRSQDDFIWLPLNDLEKVYLGDAIFTGNNSTTSIVLDSGVKLWIDPDSLVVLDQTSELMKLDLQFGNVRGSLGDQASTTLKLNINNQDLDLAGQSVEFSINKNQSAETKLQVTNGIANVIESKSRKKVQVAKDQGLKMGRGIASISNAINLNEDPVFVRQDQWARHRNVWFAQKQPLKLTWQTEGQVDRFELIISRKPTLANPIIKESLKVNGFEWNPPFDEGSFYWKVKAYGTGSATVIESEVIQWNVGLLLAPEWKDVTNPLPVSVSDLMETDKDGSSRVILQWESKLKAVFYRLEWSKDNNFSNRESLEIKLKQWSLPKLKEGKYFVRVRSEGLGRPASLWSVPLMLEVSDKDPDGLVSPKFAIPEMETLEKTGIPKLEWEGQAKASGYLVEVSDKADFSTILQSTKVKDSTWTGTGKTNGDFFVRVFPLAPNGRRGPATIIPWHSRSLGPQWKLKGNALSIPVPRDKNDQLMPFPPKPLQWKDRGQGKVAEYLLEQDVVPEFATKKEQKLKENNWTLQGLGTGIYYYRLRSLYSDGKVSLPSDVLKVDVFEQQADGLVPPNWLSKSTESQLKGSEAAVIKLKWESVSVAAKYKIELAEDVSFTKGREEKIVTSNNTELTHTKGGNFYLRVAGLSKAKRTGPWSRPLQWKITYGAPELTPVDPVKIDVASANSPIPPTTVNLNWKAPKDIEHFSLEISENSQFTKLLGKEKMKGRTHKLKLIQPGKFKVRLKGVDESGAELTPYSESIDVKFYVNRPIPAPTLVAPKDKISYILSKMKNPQIWLEWTSDKFANVYKIEVAKDKNFKKVLHTINSKEKKMLLDHNVIRGKLYWRVKAINDEQQIESPWSQVWSMAVVDIENED